MRLQVRQVLPGSRSLLKSTAVGRGFLRGGDPWTGKRGTAMRCSVLLLVEIGMAAALAPVGAAAFTIEGVEDTRVYADRVAFRVSTTAGYDCTVALDGAAVPTDEFVEVDRPDYHELFVEAVEQGTAAITSQTVRFIVRDRARGNSEWGLPPSVRYPLIDSAAAEFAGARLVIVTPPAYPVGIEIPVIALVEEGGGRRVGVNGIVTAPERPDLSLRLLRGVGSAFLPPATTPGSLAYTARIHGVSTPIETTIEADPPWTAVSGTLSAATIWGEDARMHVTGDLTVAAGATLTIAAGSVVMLAERVEVNVLGALVVNGTRERPVVFTPETRSRPWGGLLFRTSASVAEMTGAIFTGSGADDNWMDSAPDDVHSHRDEQPLLYVVNGARATLTDCYIVDNEGQAGHGDDATITMTRCLVQRCTVGGQYNGGSVTLAGCAFIEFPGYAAPFSDDDSDAIYFTGGTHSLTDCLVGWCLDDGVDAGSGAGGTVEIRGSWFEACYHEALAWSSGSGTRRPMIRDTVAINCGQGIESGWGTPVVDADRCFCTNNLVGARFGDNYDWDYNGSLTVTNSLLLYNRRNIWGRTWDDWTERLGQMDLRGNFVCAADPLHPDNTVWDPPVHADRLIPFMPVPEGDVGVGWALPVGAVFDLAHLASGVPVGLSTFTTMPVSVNWRAASDQGPLGAGTLEFAPGQTLQFISLGTGGMGDPTVFELTLADPVNAELAGKPRLHILRNTTLIPAGSVWKYYDGPTDQGTAWRELAFDDSAWSEGPAELGYGDGDEATVIQGGPSDNRHPTAYFRRRFDVTDPAAFDTLLVDLQRDDGGVVYINGREVLRSNMPPGTITYTTWAAGTTSDEDAFYRYEAGADLLVAGTNIVAVEIHQANATSSDVSFDLALLGVPVPPVLGQGFVRGDANGDGRLDVSDAVKMLRVLFAGVATDCEDALDANDDGTMDIADAVYVLAYLFGGGTEIPAPFPAPGEDPTDDGLGCERV